MRFRKLRIAFCAMCLIACVLLIALWVRSYSWLDNSLVFTNPAIVSLRGKLLVVTRLEVAYGPNDRSTLIDHRNWIIEGYSDRLKDIQIVALTPVATLPIWVPIVVLSTLATAPWVRWRFSLRTLLLATTLIAVAIGLIVWLAK